MREQQGAASNRGINVTGRCFETTLVSIEKDSSKSAATEARNRAVEVLDKCVTAYERAFGTGDVGRAGTARVAKPFKPTAAAPIGNDTNGLIYGKVQSGKTNLSIALTALAVANHFRVFVVLTSDNTWLGKQTYGRFRDGLVVAGPRVAFWEDWRADPKAFANAAKDDVDDFGIVLVCTKNVRNLEGLREVLRGAKAGRAPAMVIDDEADNASLNTAESKGDDADSPSRIFDLIGDIRQAIPNHLYLQVTATPQSLLLQRLDSPMKPAFAVVAKPGDAYVGGDLFFADSSPYVCDVDPSELDALRGGQINPGDAWQLPDGLRLALCCFVLASAYKMSARDADPREVYSMLIHICHKRINHDNIARAVNIFLPELDRALRGRLGKPKQTKAEVWMQQARQELERTARDLPPQPLLLEVISERLRSARPQVINADNPNAEPQYQLGMNILIGGNRLGRGVTIKGLMVTYYGRDAKQKMTDTVHQHARMFGYRQNLLDVTRLFSAPHITGAFRDIHEADEGTRDLILQTDDVLAVKPVWLGANLKPTRACVLNPAAVGTMPSGRLLFPPTPKFKKKEVAENTERLDKLLADFPDGDLHQVPIGLLPKLVELMPSEHVEGYTWEDRRVLQVLRAMMEPGVGLTTGWLQVLRGRRDAGRDIRRTDDGVQSSGYLSGPETTAAKQKADAEPVLVITMQRGGPANKWEGGNRFYVPTLFLPRYRATTGARREMFAFMFSYD